MIIGPWNSASSYYSKQFVIQKYALHTKYASHYFTINTELQHTVYEIQKKTLWPQIKLPRGITHSNTEIVGFNPTRGTDVCLRLFCLCWLPCVSSRLATGWSPVQGILPSVRKIHNFLNNSEWEQTRQRSPSRQKQHYGLTKLKALSQNRTAQHSLYSK
jgi:hypothetical protein